MKNRFSMMIKKMLGLMVCSITISSCGATMNTSLEEPSTRHLVRIGDVEVEMDFPPNESPDYPRLASSGLVDTSDSRFDEYPYSITMLKKWWDFHSGLLGKKVGTLGVQFRVNKVPPNFEGNITTNNDLAQLELGQFIEAGYQSSVVGDAKVVNGIEWVQIVVRGKSELTVFAAAMSSVYYIELQFDYVDNLGGSNNKWTDEAAKTVDVILATIRLA